MWKLYLWNCNLLINIANNLPIQLSVRFIHWFLYRFHIAIVESSIYRKRNFHRYLLINRANLLLAEQSAVRHFDRTMNCIIRKIYFVTTKICKKKLISNYYANRTFWRKFNSTRKSLITESKQTRYIFNYIFVTSLYFNDPRSPRH